MPFSAASGAAASSRRSAAARTQEERRAETRSKLLEATLSSIADVGVVATTSRRVSELAGVSQGAQTHHFPLRVDLLGAAVEYLADRRIAELHEIAEDLPGNGADRIAALVDLIWADFNSDTFYVFVKLWVAADDDPELYERLIPIEQHLAEEISSLASLVAGDKTMALPEWGKRFALALSAVRGLALTVRFEPRGRRRRDPWPELRATLLETLVRDAG